jgi:hypothetical protein
MAERDLDALRQAGFAERELVGVAAAAAYRNFITRIGDGLGVELGVYGDGYYDSAVLRAFGVTERAIGGTLYADRENATSGRNARPRRDRTPSPVHADDQRIAWIEMGDAQAEDATTSDVPLRNLADALSLKPDTRATTLEFAYLVDADGSGLGARSEAVIGLTVAATLGLTYLGAHHVQRLLDAGMTPGEVRTLIDESTGERSKDSSARSQASPRSSRAGRVRWRARTSKRCTRPDWTTAASSRSSPPPRSQTIAAGSRRRLAFSLKRSFPKRRETLSEEFRERRG